MFQFAKYFFASFTKYNENEKKCFVVASRLLAKCRFISDLSQFFCQGIA